MSESFLVARIVYSVTTLYMMAVLFRWLAPYLNLELMQHRLRWIPQITDPAVQTVRRFAPPLGPWDWAPIVTVLLLWVCRTLFLGPLLPRA